MTTTSAPASVRDDARRAITDAAAAVHRASMAHTSVFPAASPGRAREVDADGLVRWGAQDKSGPEACDRPEASPIR